MGYALEYNAFIRGVDLGLSTNALIGKNTAEILETVRGKSETWMNTYLNIDGIF